MRRARRRPARSARPSLLGRIAIVASTRPRLVVGIWIALVAVLAFQGRHLERELTIHPLLIDGSQSARAQEIAKREFGDNFAMVVMLRGPRASVEQQGRELARRLNAVPRILVVSPWARGASIEGLRPSPGVAALIVRVEPKGGDELSGLLPPVQRQIDRSVTNPVQARVAGLPVVINSIRSSGEHAAALGELIAVPVLLIVLLLVFRSVLAALLPVIVGGAVVAASRGVLSLLVGAVQIDVLALSVVGMMGLALGVDYSLLVVSRFREEQARDDTAGAVQATVEATARSILPAGSALLLAMVVSLFVLPGSFARSVSVAVMTAAILSVLSAICVVPALLALAGENLDRWAWPKRAGAQVAPLRWSRRVAARPRAVIAIMLGLVVCAAWAFTLNTGDGTLALLPTADPGRRQQEEVKDALGPGWIAPTEVIVSGRGSPVTSPSRLRAMQAFQRRVEKDPGVQTMAGLARVADAAKQLRGIKGELADQETGLDRLETGISRLHRGALLSTTGLQKAAKGSRALDSGIGAAGTGAGVLANALQKASTGSGRLAQGLSGADEGSGQLAEGTTKASTGAGRLAEGLEQAREKTGEVLGSATLFKNAMRSGEDRLDELHEPLQGTEEQLAAALQAMQRMTTGRADPEYAAALAALEQADLHLTGTDPRTGEQPDPSLTGVEAGVERADGQFGVGLYLASRLEKSGKQANSGMEKLARGSARLDRGLQRLATGSRRLSDGVEALADGGEQLSPAMRRLSQGAGHLATGLGLLGTGAGRLADGLGSGADKSKLLSGGLGRIGDGLESQRGDSQLGGLGERSPGLFRSAYFVLAGLDGSRPRQRSQVASLINLDRGGMDARMLVIPRDEPMSAGAEATTSRLKQAAADLARKTGTEVAVGGVGPGDIDINNALREQAPLLRLVLALVTFLILVPVMRSLTMPAIAALINLVMVSATFGLMSVLFNGSLLGGPGYVDTTIVPVSMLVMFGLAVDYEVFVFARIREEYVRTGSTANAIKNGLDHTAHVVTGAAIIMLAVFLSFSVSDFISIRNFGVSQAIAVFLDAFIVRLIVIPAVMGRLGDWCWYMPGWLDRLLPGGGAAGVVTERPEVS